MNTPLHTVASSAMLTVGTPGVSTPLAQAQSTSSTLPTKTYSNENTFIYQETLKFERELQKLTSSIQHYVPDPEICSNLVTISDNVNKEIDQLELLHDLKSNQMLKQTVENTQLNETLRSVVVTLNNCRKELNELPKLPMEEEIKLSDPQLSTSEDKLNEPSLDATKKLLAYAMKLSKFSKIPRTFDGPLLPNNFVWPGDDNMRRGVLAMASMMPDKIISNENGPDEQTPAKPATTSNEDVKMKDDSDDDSDDDFLNENSRRASDIGTSGTPGEKTPKKKEHADVMAALDFFDESDEDMD